MDAKTATTFLISVPQAGRAFIPLDPAGDRRFYDPVTGQTGHSISALIERCNRRNAEMAAQSDFEARQFCLDLA